MVNSGYGMIKCNSCDHGCLVKTAVNRNKALEQNVVTQKCEHFEMSISIFTNSNYVAWIVGPRDRISFYLNAKCLNCNSTLSNESTKEGFETGTNSFKKSCPNCENAVVFLYEFLQSFFDDIIMDSVRRLLPVIPDFSVRIENHLETKKF